MRDEKEGRKKQARSNKQTRQNNTAHPRQSRTVHCVSYYNAAYFAGEFEDLFCDLKHDFKHVGTGRSAR